MGERKCPCCAEKLASGQIVGLLSWTLMTITHAHTLWLYHDILYRATLLYVSCPMNHRNLIHSAWLSNRTLTPWYIIGLISADVAYLGLVLSFSFLKCCPSFLAGVSCTPLSSPQGVSLDCGDSKRKSCNEAQRNPHDACEHPNTQKMVSWQS